jgi:hypothetical protein
LGFRPRGSFAGVVFNINSAKKYSKYFF